MKFIDLTGQKFGRYYLKEKDEEASKKHGSIYYKCICECGTERSVSARDLRSGDAKSCGCLKNELTSKRSRKYNELELFEELGFGKCYFNNSDEYFIFDIEDLDIVKAHCWHKNCNGYAITNLKVDENKEDGEKFFHRLVMKKHYGDISNFLVDHQDHNKLNNRKYNLRLCTKSDNSRNKVTKGSNTGYTNIYYYEKDNNYEFRISINGDQYTKRFPTLNEVLSYREWFYNEYKIIDYVYNKDLDIRNKSSDMTIPFIDSDTGNLLKRGVITPFYYLEK